MATRAHTQTSKQTSKITSKRFRGGGVAAEADISSRHISCLQYVPIQVARSSRQRKSSEYDSHTPCDKSGIIPPYLTLQRRISNIDHDDAVGHVEWIVC